MLGSALAVVAATVCAYLVSVVMRIEVKHPSHYLLIAGALALGLWNACAYCVYNASTQEQLMHAFLLSTVGMFVFVATNNAFAFFVFRHGPEPWWYLVIVSIPTLVFALMLFADPAVFVTFERAGSEWRFYPNRNSLPNLLWLVYAFLLMASCQIYLAFRLCRTILRREQKQLRVLIVSGLIAWIPALLQLLMHDTVPGMPKVLYTPVFLLAWAIGNTVAVQRYQFLGITPDQLSRDILKSTRDLVILAAANGSITYINETALRFFGRPSRELMSQSVDNLLCGPGSTATLLPAPPEDPSRAPISRRIAVTAESHDRLLRTIDLEISTVNDRFHDFLGYLLVGSLVEPPRSLMDRFELTRRECDLVQCILNGWSYTTIADSLHISESTIKSHISHIYQKLRIHNRMDLIRIFEHQDMHDDRRASPI